MPYLRLALAATLAAVVAGPLAALERDEARHLLLRTGYGPTPAEIDALLTHRAAGGVVDLVTGE
ncbi:MAG TPA: hypothetical protein VHX44_17420, partial [Planctomycetota bacterium]|nr:hypothetical protein [Planctomycetota bacterium]